MRGKVLYLQTTWNTLAVSNFACLTLENLSFLFVWKIPCGNSMENEIVIVYYQIFGRLHTPIVTSVKIFSRSPSGAPLIFRSKRAFYFIVPFFHKSLIDFCKTMGYWPMQRSPVPLWTICLPRLLQHTATKASSARFPPIKSPKIYWVFLKNSNWDYKELREIQTINFYTELSVWFASSEF